MAAIYISDPRVQSWCPHCCWLSIGEHFAKNSGAFKSPGRNLYRSQCLIEVDPGYAAMKGHRRMLQ
jgi:hypothetical protein